VQLFLIFAVPISYLYFLTVTGQSSASPLLLSRAIAKGALFSVLVLTAAALLRRFVSVSQSGFAYYFVTSLEDMWLPTIILVGLYAWSTREFRDQPPSERQTTLRSFLVGGFTVLSFFDLFLPAGYYSPYDLFLLPAMRVSLMLAAPAFFYLYSDTMSWHRYLILLGLFLLPFVYGVVFLLQSANFDAWATLVAATLLVGSASLAIATAGGLRSLRY